MTVLQIASLMFVLAGLKGGILVAVQGLTITPLAKKLDREQELL